MQRLHDFQLQLSRATTLRSSPWVCAFALIAGALVARIIVAVAPTNFNDLATAKGLGITSESILGGHSITADMVGFVLAISAALATSLFIWIIWAMRTARADQPLPDVISWSTPRTSTIEMVAVTLLAFVLFARFWNGHAATFSAFTTLVEEGEMLAWVDSVLRGRALFRDAFCLYGPLSVWAVATLFWLFKPSLGLWRHWIFALNAPALIAVYFLSRGISRTRIAAAACTIVVALVCASAVPAMSWSLCRVGLGLAALAALTRGLDRTSLGWSIATGALLATTLLYSPEIGAASIIAVAIVLLFKASLRATLWTGFGMILVLAPAAIYLATIGALKETIDGLFLFSRFRMLGFAGAPFPHLEFDLYTLRAYFVPVVLTVSGFWTATKLLRGLRDARVLTQLGLFIFGAVLFTAALTRPDESHLTFVAPPGLILLACLLEDAAFAVKSQNQRLAAVTGLTLGTLGLLLPWTLPAYDHFFTFIQPPSGRTIPVPRAGSALFPEEFALDLDRLTHAIQTRTSPNEPIWVFPGEALLYFLADRPQPTRFPQVVFAVTRAQRQELVADLERNRPRWTIIYRDAPELEGIPYSVAVPEVVEYLEAHYQFEINIGSFELLRRKD